MEIRKARMGDVRGIQSLVNQYAAQELMLPRPLSVLYETLRDFVVAVDDGEVKGVGALHFVWEDLAEIRALAIAPPLRQGVGRRIVEALVEEARQLDVARVFALTYQVPFFERLGFRVVGKETLPHKVWTECINCNKFPACDEVAVDLVLVPGRGIGFPFSGIPAVKGLDAMPLPRYDESTESEQSKEGESLPVSS